MNLTKESHNLMSFFMENNCLLPIQQIKTQPGILPIFTEIYNEIKKGFSYIHKIKTKMGNTYYTIHHIENVSQIPRPTTFPPNSFPLPVRKHIDDKIMSVITYSFHLFNRPITILFLTENDNPEKYIETYNKYVDAMLVWLYIVDQYASRNCASELKIFIYHTSLLKQLPKTNVEILGENHVNTAFTRTCPQQSEIVVFRKEEWFKVFIHETFHSFGLDFSDMNCDKIVTQLLDIFPVNSDVNLFESYTEFWARIMNAAFCSYIHSNNFNVFLTNVEIFINFERIYAFFQMVKVLNFMEMSYTDLYQKSDISQAIRKTMYKEKTSVLSYYVITMILLYHYQDFLLWCNKHNKNNKTHYLLQFKKTHANLAAFLKFIQNNYRSENMLVGIQCTEQLLQTVKKTHKKKRSNDLGYVVNNLRMTICELG